MSYQDALNHLKKAQRLFIERNYEMALVELDEAAHIAPDFPEVYFWRGKTLATDLNEENLKAGIEEISHAINLKPDYTEAYLERGKIYLQLGQLEKAEKDFNKVLTLKPNLEEAYIYLAQIHLARGNYEKALESLQKVYKKEGKDNYKYFFYLGKIHFNNKEYTQAIELLSKALQLNPYLVDAYDLRAQSYKETGEYKNAIEDFKKAYTLMPEEKRFFVEISNIHFKIADEFFDKGDIINSATHIVEGMEINYDIKLDEKYKEILIEAGRKITNENPHKAILFFDFALRLVDETNFQKAEKEREEIKSYRKEAIKNLPFKERIIKIISDIYTGV
ncbi:MAG: hypothetical protein DSY47_02855 [Hydrogenothermus sp.]|nr:MAG: hypothetical protein DSY47_02855 [Hydrogenothermus sp.]